MISMLLLMVISGAEGERTVLVTPRPRWLVQEPRADPSNPSIPSILPSRVPVFSIRVLPPNPNSVMSAALPMEHRMKVPELLMEAVPAHRLSVQRKPLLQPPLVVVSPAVYSQPLRETVFVESVPSLSIQLQDQPLQDESLADYLTPPRYPSVYETMDVASTPAPQPPEKKQKIETKKLNPVTTVDETSNDIEDSLTPDFKKQITGERIEFQLHGQAGPDSYKFGFDTGAGKNRQFRYEEKDGVGNVKGHFGYYDTNGKLQLFNYHADETGFHAVQVD